MINNYLKEQIKENFSFKPTFEQDLAIQYLSEFLLSRTSDAAFILRGYAGTGKTSLVSALVRTMDRMQQKAVLLAPTGRAAKVFSAYAGHPAFTIHKKIYRQKSFSNDLDNFSLNDNLYSHTLFIVDEASMISNSGLSGTMFGSGRLLDDLIQYVYSGTECRLLLMGDTAQLPPVGEGEGPALSIDVISAYGLKVKEIDLTQVVRQEEQSGILWNATQLRECIANEECYSLPKIRLTGFPDIELVAGDGLVDLINTCYDKDGMDQTIVICRSNKRANIYNKGIRQSILFRDDELCTGDLLMVTKNNYYWTEKNKDVDFIANGDVAIVRRVRKTKELHGFRFAEVVLEFPDYEGMELEVNVLLDTLHADSPALSKEDGDKLYFSVTEDYNDITVKKDRLKKVKDDPYYNALQVKYAYAVTCHKAQGGQWENVFLDQGYLADDYLTPDYFRWLYTAVTRATRKLYLVNYPAAQTT